MSFSAKESDRERCPGEESQNARIPWTRRIGVRREGIMRRFGLDDSGKGRIRVEGVSKSKTA